MQISVLSFVFPLKNLILPVYIAHEVRSLAEGKRDIIYVNENCHNFFRCRRIFADFGYVILHNLKYYWCKFQYYLFFFHQTVLFGVFLPVYIALLLPTNPSDLPTPRHLGPSMFNPQNKEIVEGATRI